MSFESMWLCPTLHPLDVGALEAWLAASPCAWRDPVEGRIWYLGATPRLAELARRARLADPSRFPYGVLIWWTDRLHVDACADHDGDRRLVDLLRVLRPDPTWTVKLDWGEPRPFSTLQAMFPGVDLDAPRAEDDLTTPPVVLGTLVTVQEVETTLRVHSDGDVTLTIAGHDQAFRLTPEACATWNTAVATADWEDPALPDLPSPDALQLRRETPEAEDQIWLEPAALPPSFGPLLACARRWMAALRGGDATPGVWVRGGRG